jgi:hypothetical protein
MTAKRALVRARAPHEPAVEERAWAVVRSAYRERTAVVSQRPTWRLAAVPAVVAVIAGVALSPAGATVGRLIQRALGVPHASHALFSLPAPGRLLVSGPGGTWTVAADGSSRRLGNWAQASWSPRGLYVAAARGDELAAVDPHGVVRWTIARPSVSEPTWYSPTGFRVAYISGHRLRVAAGDGTGDHRLANRVAHVAPAWRPDHPYQLAYVNHDGRLMIRDADSGQIIWSVRDRGVRALQWSADGSRLLVLTPARARVYDGSGRMRAQVGAPSDAPLINGALSPDGQRLAFVSGTAAQEVRVANLTSLAPRSRAVLTGAGLREAVWSPDDRWLLVSWPKADQWVFIRVAGAPRIAAVSRIAQQFGAGSGARAFPRLEGWCCVDRGGAG